METSPTPDEVRSPVLPVRLFIVSDHGLVRQGLRDLLESEGFEIAGECGSAAEATRIIPTVQADIALLDDRLPDGTGIEVCRNLSSTSPGPKCVILTGLDDHRAAQATVLAGASGYVLKQVGDHGGFAKSIRSAADGRTLPVVVKARVAEGLYATAGAPRLETMTERERTVLAFMAQGLTNRQLGQELKLPLEVVVACVSAVLQKLGFGGRAGWHRPESFRW